ncbi:MAG: ferredoxin Fer [Salinigranum sp.]
MEESPFDVLSVDPDADEWEIRRAYRRRVLETHPDQGGSSAAFQRVKDAYEAIESDALGVGGADADGADADEGGDAAPGEAEDDPGHVTSRVEYLNYEILDDYGWRIDDDDLFEKASAAGLAPDDYGRILVQPHESLLEAAENRGFAWPYACRGGACANCAVAVSKGELEMPADHILPAEMMDRGFRLSCNGMPVTDEMKVVYNLKHRPDLDDLRLPPHRFERAHAND